MFYYSRYQITSKAFLQLVKKNAITVKMAKMLLNDNPGNQVLKKIKTKHNNNSQQIIGKFQERFFSEHEKYQKRANILMYGLSAPILILFASLFFNPMAIAFPLIPILLGAAVVCGTIGLMVIGDINWNNGRFLQEIRIALNKNDEKK